MTADAWPRFHPGRTRGKREPPKVTDNQSKFLSEGLENTSGRIRNIRARMPHPDEGAGSAPSGSDKVLRRQSVDGKRRPGSDGFSAQYRRRRDSRDRMVQRGRSRCLDPASAPLFTPETRNAPGAIAAIIKSAGSTSRRRSFRIPAPTPAYRCGRGRWSCLLRVKHEKRANPRHNDGASVRAPNLAVIDPIQIDSSSTSPIIVLMRIRPSLIKKNGNVCCRAAEANS